MDRLVQFWKDLPDPVRRTHRTWWQAFIGALLLQFSVEVVPTVSALQDTVVAGAWAATVATLSLLHNLLDAAPFGPDTR